MALTTKLSRFAAIALFALAGHSALTSAAQTAPLSPDNAKVARLLEGSGRVYKTYNTANGPVWSIEELHGTSLKNMRILVGTSGGFLVMGVVVAEKAHMNVTPEFMHKLLKLTHILDRVKIGFDNDDDLFARIESPVRLLDAQDFKAQIDQVVLAADEIHRQTSVFITP
jgi:hypothetical protein